MLFFARFLSACFLLLIGASYASANLIEQVNIYIVRDWSYGLPVSFTKGVTKSLSREELCAAGLGAAQSQFNGTEVSGVWTFEYNVTSIRYGKFQRAWVTDLPGDSCAFEGTKSGTSTFGETDNGPFSGGWLHIDTVKGCPDFSDPVYSPSHGKQMCVYSPSNPDPQDCEIGDEITRPTYSPPGGSPTPSPQVCNGSCLYDYERRSAIGLEEPGFPGVGKYTAYYVGNGQSCTNPTPPELPPPPTEPPPPDPIDPVEPTDPEQGGGGSSGGGSSGGGSSGGGSSGGGSSGGGETGGGSSGGGSSGGDETGGGSSGGGSSGGGSSGGGSSGGGNGGGGNGNGNGDGDGEGEGGGSAEGVENCEAGRCDFGDNRGDPFGGDVRSFADSLRAAMSGMKNSPLGSSIGNINFPTGGTCPTGSTSINIGIGSIPINFVEHCNFWEQVAPILSAVFLALWSILAVRVFLSA